MIGVWLVFIMTLFVAWIMFVFESRHGKAVSNAAMNYIWLITVGLVLATAVLLAEVL